MNAIAGANIPSLAPPGLTNVGGAVRGEASFKNLLLESLDHVNTMQQDANKAIEQLMTGEDVNPAEVLTAVQKTDLTFKLMMQLRNKLVQAYQEVKEIRI